MDCQIAVVMPVGPDPAELARARDTLASIVAWEPAVRWLVLIDDSPTVRGLNRLIDFRGVHVEVLRSPAGASGDFWDRVTATVLAGIAWVAGNTAADMVTKIDTDSLVIAPFAAKLMSAFEAAPGVGLFGSYDVGCNGRKRSFHTWAKPVRIAASRVQLKGRHSRLAVGRAAKARTIIRDARRSGYVWGEHALACAFAIDRSTYMSWASDDVLADPTVFMGTGLGVDPVVGILVRRSGKRLASLVGKGDPFGVAWRGLPMTPAELLARGHSIIHSVKNDRDWSEESIRAFFGARR
jgi:hypothetical protein